MNKESIGARLKKAREEKKITLEQAYSKTKIHVDILQALEEDRFQEFSPIYIKGFLKIYCQFLKLDKDAILKEFQQLYLPQGSIPLKEEIPEKKIKIRWNLHKLNFKLIKKATVALTAIIVLIFLIYFLRNIRMRISSASKAKESEETVVIPAQENKKAKFARLAIRAKDNCWLKIRLDGKLIYDGTFKRNMAESWQAKEKIELSVSNAGAIEVEINGQVLSPLGRKGQAIKNIVITKDGFTIGK